MRPIDADAVCERCRKSGAICTGSGCEIPTMPTLTPPNEWVSVEERSPENNAQVLMWSAKWNIAEAGSYYNERFWVYSEIGDAYIADDITHWMSLPAPPDRRPPEVQS